MSEYRAGDEILFKFEGLLPARVESVTFKGRKVRYKVTASLEFEVPESLVLAEKGEEE